MPMENTTYDGIDGELQDDPVDAEVDPVSGDKQFRITDLPRVENIAAILDDKRLTEIATAVWDEYDIDKKSRVDKEAEWDAASQAFETKREAKSYPFANASNVKFPLLLTAAIQFQSRAMPAVVHDGKVAKGKPVGDDPQGMKAEQASRVGGYMNYQLLEKDDAWVEETDKALLQLPIFGDVIKKIYRDPVLGNRSELVSVRDFVVNVAYPSLDRAPRYTHRLDLYPNEIEVRKRTGRFLNVDLINSGPTETDDKKKPNLPDVAEDKSSPHEFLEQYRGLDLDDDGYDEPYIVTLHVPSKKVVRIVTCYDQGDIKTDQTGTKVISISKRPDFVRYPFIPDPDGGFYSIGFGKLLMDPVATINSVINQILDAGSLQNAGGGFIGKEFRLKAGTIKSEPGLWRQMTFSGDDIRKSMVPMEHPGPSAVLFQMLGFLVDMAKDITATQSDVLTGETGGQQQTATTTLALIEQGLKVFTGIVGRVLRSLTAELKALYDLNARYMGEDEQEYFNFGDTPQYVMRQDFNKESCDVKPVADASVVTDMQKMARAQIIGEMRDDPFINPIEARKRFFEAQGIPIAGLLQEPPQNPLVQEGQQAEVDKMKADTQKALADALKAFADAEATGQQVEIERVKTALDGISKLIGASKPDEPTEQGTVPGMAGQPGDTGGSPSPEELLALFPPEMGAAGMGNDMAFNGAAIAPEQPQDPQQFGGGMVGY